MEDPEKLKEKWCIASPCFECARRRLGLTADAIGTTVSNYQRIEYGGQNLTFVTMAKIADATGVGVSAAGMSLRRLAS